MSANKPLNTSDKIIIDELFGKIIRRVNVVNQPSTKLAIRRAHHEKQSQMYISPIPASKVGDVLSVLTAYDVEPLLFKQGFNAISKIRYELRKFSLGVSFIMRYTPDGEYCRIEILVTNTLTDPIELDI